VNLPPPKPRAGVLEPTVFAIVGIAILVGLGTWQLDRGVWKRNLVEALTTRLARTPANLPPREEWQRLKQQDSEFTRVRFPAEFLPGEEALVYTAGSALRTDVKGPGYWVFAPARLAGGSIVAVNRGFVPLDRKEPDARAQGTPLRVVDIVGVMRWPEERGTFTPADNPASNLWHVRDVPAIAAAKQWQAAAPFYIDQEAPVPDGGWPRPGPLTVNLPDNHAQYAITWFGLALALAGVYITWLVKRLRRPY
jgi:surfeit locus 1 family protein